jgi:ankyrin repeat protein
MTLRYDTLWKDPTRFFQLSSLVSDTKSMLVEHLLDTDEEITFESIEKFDKFCLKYFENKTTLNNDDDENDDDDDESYSTLSNILLSLPSEQIDKIIPSTQFNLLHLVIQNNDMKLVKLLLDSHANASYPDLKQGNISLHYACRNGHSDITLMLLTLSDPPVSLNYQNLLLKTSLHYCCEGGHDVCTRLLLRQSQRGVGSMILNLDLRDHNGNTPLHLACIDGHLINVQLLLIAGCDQTIRNNDHKTPLEVVRLMAQRDAIRQELESHSLSSVSSQQPSSLLALDRVEVKMTAQGSEGSFSLFDGMELKESSSGNGKEMHSSSQHPPDLFMGLKVSSVTSSAVSTSPIELPPPTHLTQTYLQNKFTNPAAITLKPSIPTGRWIVMQSNKVVLDESSAKLIIHRNK